MSNGFKKIWDRLASGDERLATDGFNACSGNPLAEPIGTPDSVAEIFTPLSGQWLLDVGCGWGKMVLPCLRAGMTAVGVDISTIMLRKLREQAGGEPGNLHLVNAEAGALPFASDQFDVVWSHSVLMHLSRQEAEEGIAEMARVMKPSGCGYLHFKNSYHTVEAISRLHRLYSRMTARGPSPIYRRSYSLPEVRRILHRYFLGVDVWVESFQVFPVAIPDNLLTEIGSLNTGIPSSQQGSYRPLGSPKIANALVGFFDLLKRFSNGPFPKLKFFGKEFVAVVSQPRTRSVS
jgi:ubiquinone/menaquinone biosynthesis C-methylase UbiE